MCMITLYAYIIDLYVFIDFISERTSSGMQLVAATTPATAPKAAETRAGSVTASASAPPEGLNKRNQSGSV